jgi:hypothetical protein
MEALFERRKEQENHDATDRSKSLEAKIIQLEQHQDDVEKHWLDLEHLTGGMPPQIVLALIAVLSATVVLFGEAIFLAPVMDGFGIADPVWQMIFSGVLVVVCSGLIHITKTNWPVFSTSGGDDPGDNKKISKKPNRWVKFIGFGVMAVFAFALVSLLGWWRAEEMIFAASAQSGAWTNFLAENPTLTRLVVVLLTTALPVFVAAAVDWGLDSLRLAWDWRTTRWTLKNTTAQLEDARKSLEAELEKKDARIKALGQQCSEWRNAYLQRHDLGEKVGARQLPLWRIIAKIAAVALLVLVSLLFFDPLLSAYLQSDSTRYVLYSCVVLSVGGLYAFHALNAWDRPNARRLYKHKAVIFRRDDDDKTSEVKAAKPLYIPNSGNGQGEVLPPPEQVMPTGLTN